MIYIQGEPAKPSPRPGPASYAEPTGRERILGVLEGGDRSPANRGPSNVGRGSSEKPHLAQHV